MLWKVGKKNTKPLRNGEINKYLFVGMESYGTAFNAISKDSTNRTVIEAYLFDENGKKLAYEKFQNKQTARIFPENIQKIKTEMEMNCIPIQTRVWIFQQKSGLDQTKFHTGIQESPFEHKKAKWISFQN